MTRANGYVKCGSKKLKAWPDRGAEVQGTRAAARVEPWKEDDDEI